MIRTLLIASFAIGMAQTAAAQLQPIVKPVQNRHYGSYSMTNGFQPAPPVGQRFGAALLWDNWHGDEVFYMPGVGNQTWGIDDELIDQFAFPRAGLSGTDQVNGVTFDYCSSVPDPGSNDVLPVNLYIYDDFIDPSPGATSPTGWPIANCEYMMLLPGGNFAGTAAYCWTIGLDMRLGLECTVPQEQTVGGMETCGAGWTYGDPRPVGDSGPIVDNISVNPPGYGAIDEVRLHDRSTQSFVGQVWGNGSNYFLSHVATWEGMPTGTEAYYHENPFTLQPAPRPGDTLFLTPDVALTAGGVVEFSVASPDPFRTYALVASTAQADIAKLLSAPATPVQATLLVNLGQTVAPPASMPGGDSGPIILPIGLPLVDILFQAFEHTGSLSANTVTAASNGVKATIQ